MMPTIQLPDALPFVTKGEEPSIDDILGPVLVPPPAKPKRKKPAAVTPLSMRLLEAEGYLVERVEHWNSFVRRRADLWQFTDLLAIRRGEVLAVQVTSAQHHSDRRTKIADNPKVGIVREAGIRIEIHSWRKVGGKWQVRREDLS